MYPERQLTNNISHSLILLVIINILVWHQFHYNFQRLKTLAYNPTPVQEIAHPAAKSAGVKLLVKREDLNHPYVSGNKWWKLKYNLASAADRGIPTLLTFGGAFSNHLYATAAAAYALNLKSIGIIRGEETLPLNPTLQFAKDRGMIFKYVSREQYRRKAEPEFIEKLRQEFGGFYEIPEGGSNILAVTGCAEFAERELSKIDFDYLCLPVGTGGTIAGLICGFRGKKNIIGVSVLKNGEFLQTEIINHVHDFSGQLYPDWSLLTAYHHGGYAKVTNDLVQFIGEMKVVYDLPLDPVYTGKLVWGVLKEIESGSFKRGSTILLLHTGGLQGIIN